MFLNFGRNGLVAFLVEGRLETPMQREIGGVGRGNKIRNSMGRGRSISQSK
jgi:hypothetical protein